MIEYVLISSFLISLIAFIGILFVSMSEKVLNSVLFILIAFAAGTMLGNVFFHIMPETFEEINPLTGGFFLMAGFSVFFVLEKLIHWHHCHDIGERHGRKHVFGYLNMIGDGVHNFIDGILIAASYIVSIPVGIATTLAILSHEVPQEIGDFGVLVYSGFSKGKALMFNFASALLAVIGAVLGWYIFNNIDVINYILPLAAGSLMYIATTDLMPELHKEGRIDKSAVAFAFFILGLALLYFLKILFEG